ncbi:centrosomal protein of 41 kDa-like isoform X2 [Liolophura sinensis]|uniref:centrosomal protein of 41 kDa-like isoform X2 n=1 Tax=Liolophura sinensis TaxID=3198878 RepID=UPI0031585107
MSAMSTSRARKVDPMGKKIHANPKYKHVKATVDTGASLSKYLDKIDEIRRNYRYRNDELFKRMKVSTFVQLVIQVANYESMQSEPFPDNISERPDTADSEVKKIQAGGDSPTPSLALTENDYGPVPPETARSTFESIARGVGELDIEKPVPPPVNRFVDHSSPYLLLDVRDADAYNQCHLISAKSFPSAMLSRSVNGEIKELLVYKNQPGKIIVLYDEDERIAPKAASTLVERGYDNLFLLSGGLRIAAKLFPEGLITGTLPQSLTQQKPKQITTAERKIFSRMDLDKLQIYLDGALQDNSIGSRLSKAGTASSRMSSTCPSYMSQDTLGRKPFRP